MAKKDSSSLGRAQRPHIFAACEPEKLKQVADLLRETYTSSQIREICCAQWGCSPPTVTRYIKAVYSLWEDEGRDSGVHARDLARERFAALYQRCLQEGDLGVAAGLLDKLAKLDAAYAPERSEVAIVGGISLTTDSALLESRLEGLIAERLSSKSLGSQAIPQEPLQLAEFIEVTPTDDES